MDLITGDFHSIPPLSRISATSCLHTHTQGPSLSIPFDSAQEKISINLEERGALPGVSASLHFLPFRPHTFSGLLGCRASHGHGALEAFAASRFDSLHQTQSSEKVVSRLVKQQFEGLCPVISIFWCLTHFCPPSVSAVPGTHHKNAIQIC